MVTPGTLVFHICEKSGDIHIPDVGAVYAQILAADGDKHDVVLMPEYAGNEVWADTLDWITDNFTDIPVMLAVFGGGPGETPIYQLTTEQITAAMAVCDVQWIAIGEVIAWYMGHPLLEFPVDYITGLLEFCDANGLKVFWTEWKMDHVFETMQTYIAGYEGIVYASFSTNSGDLEPAKGFAHVKGLSTHWGASVQSWYWETRHRTNSQFTYSSELNDPDNMPVAWLVEHALEAKSAGAELIEFEPYWYFFGKTDGIAKVSLKNLLYFLNSSMAGMETSAIILQTLQAEWLNGPAKAKIVWLDGRVETGWDLQPSAHDFVKMPQNYAVSCYGVGSANPASRVWLKVDVVAVEVLVKVLGTTQEKAALTREAMRAEVERILYLYSAVAPLWDVNPFPGPHRRRIPGLKDVVISQQVNQSENSSLARVTVQVRCRVFPKKSWVS